MTRLRTLVVLATGGLLLVSACGKGTSTTKKGSKLPMKVTWKMEGQQLVVTVETEPKATFMVWFKNNKRLRFVGDTVLKVPASGKAVVRSQALPAGKKKLTLVVSADRPYPKKGKARFEKLLNLDVSRRYFVRVYPVGKQKKGVACRVSLKEKGRYRKLDKAYGNFAITAEGMLTMRFNSLGGKAVKIAGRTFPFKGSSAHVKLPVKKIVGAMSTGSLSGVKGAYEVKLPVVVTLQGNPWQGSLSCQGSVISWLLLKVKDGPVKFAGDKRTKRRRSLVIHNDGSWRNLGANVKIREVDLVATMESIYKEHSPCHYRGETTGKKTKIDRTSWGYKAAVYDRRTGRRLGKKRWMAPKPGCADRTKATTKGFSQSVSEDKVYKWAKGFIR